MGISGEKEITGNPPFIDYRCEKVARKIIKIIKNYTPEFNVNVCWSNITLERIFSPKLKLKKATFEKLNFIYQFECECGEKYIGETRDFGNANNNWVDVILDDYFIFDFESSYQYAPGYKLFFNIANILDQEYEQAYQYSTMGRDIHLGI